MANALEALGLTEAPKDRDDETDVEEAPETPEVVETPEVEEQIEVPEGADRPDAVKAAIQAERNKAKEANARARELKRQLEEREEAGKPLEERVKLADARAAAAELNSVRVTVAAKHGILNLATRLQGSTLEELEADAETLKADFKPATPAPAPGFDGGIKQAAPPAASKDPAKDHNAFITNILRGAQQG